jgi:hypothetical protein
MKIRHLALLTYAFAACGCAATSSQTPTYPTLTQDGKVLSSTCNPDNLRALKESFESHHYKNETIAWKAVNILLCGQKSAENIRHIKNMMATKLTASSDYTGQDNAPQTFDASDEVAANLFATGIAYDSSIRNFQGAMFKVFYTTDEVCIASRTFKYENAKWVIAATGEACD